MRLARRLGKIMAWGLLLLSLGSAGAAWFAYALLTNGETAARVIRGEALRFLPQAFVETGKVNIALLRGQITVTQVQLRQWIDGQPFLTGKVPWISMRLDPHQLLHGRFEPGVVIISQPTLRLCRRRDGTWNLQGLIADPWPAPAIQNPPPIFIRNGTIQLISRDDAEGGFAPQSSSSAAGGDVALLRDVFLKIEGARDGWLHFEGSAHGDLFAKLSLEGSINPATGEATLGGELAGLTISENLHRRLPSELRRPFEAVALNRGELDLELRRLAIQPARAPDCRLDYDATLRLRGGVWECPSLPFPINDLDAHVAIRNGQVTIKHAEGTNGSTIVRAAGTLAGVNPASSPFDLRVDLLRLELDRRLQAVTPPQFANLWDVFKPRGQVDAYLHVARECEAGPVGAGATVVCRDVAAEYRHFRYPLEHMSGRLTFEKQRLKVEMHGLVGERPASIKGVVDNPGPDAVCGLQIDAQSVPIDDTFMTALPDDVRKVVAQFHPAGSVKAAVQVTRTPMHGPGARPEGHVEVHADLDLNPRCEITWAGLPYPIRNLTGKLELHPDHWVFRNMRGNNGPAQIAGNGEVWKLPGPNLPSGEPPLKIDLQITAEDLPFNEDLRKALQPAWQKTWSIINPNGASDVTAAIHIEPDVPGVNHITIVPKPEASVRLLIERSPQPGVEQGRTLELRMENVGGRFDFVNGKVAMNDVAFFFHGAPVQFSSGEVTVEDSGRFALQASNLWVKEIRLDSSLRKLMPPLMAQFALRLDDSRPFTARGNLEIGWSGHPGEPAWCRWNETSVVFIDNTLKASIPLEHIQGQLRRVRGWSDGKAIEVHGILELASVSFMGQQITEVESPIHIERGAARLDDLQAKLLAGRLRGKGSITLDLTPKYTASLRLYQAQLEKYTQTLPGRQSFRGSLTASIDLSGLGSDVRSIQGYGEAHMAHGDFGELPVALRFVNFLNSNLALFDGPRTSGNTLFDSADVFFRIDQGTAKLDPIKLTGTAFSLQGKGIRDPQGNLDLRLSVLYGRDRFHLPVVSDLLREASGQIFIVHVVGPSANPKFTPEALPQVQRLGARRSQQIQD